MFSSPNVYIHDGYKKNADVWIPSDHTVYRNGMKLGVQTF